MHSQRWPWSSLRSPSPPLRSGYDHGSHARSGRRACIPPPARSPSLATGNSSGGRDPRCDWSGTRDRGAHDEPVPGGDSPPSVRRGSARDSVSSPSLSDSPPRHLLTTQRRATPRPAPSRAQQRLTWYISVRCISLMYESKGGVWFTSHIRHFGSPPRSSPQKCK